MAGPRVQRLIAEPHQTRRGGRRLELLDDVSDRLRVCLVAPLRFPIGEPFVGGLEAHTAALADGLAARGHHVEVVAVEGTRLSSAVRVHPSATFRASDQARSDLAAPPDRWMHEHHAYLEVMLRLSRSAPGRFDVVHNNSLHHLPVAMASALPMPIVTTLHTPPLPWLESAVALSGGAGRFVAVSEVTARAWRPVVDADVVHNGVDTDVWTPGPGGGGGGPAVWSGRLVPEKAPHHAIDAARRTGVPLVLAGPMLDQDYARREVLPRLGDGVDYVGHLDHARLREIVRAARVAVVSSVWDEPYGLVAAEAMACGTPVAGYASGALGEVVGGGGGVLATPGDVADLARAVRDAMRLDRSTVRAFAVQHCSHERMLSTYEAIYESVLVEPMVAS